MRNKLKRFFIYLKPFLLKGSEYIKGAGKGIYVQIVRLIQQMEPVLSKVKEQTIFRLEQWRLEMVGPIEKGIAAAKLQIPPAGVLEGVDLRILPKYICFKAALLHNKLTLQYIILVISSAFAIHFVASLFEVRSLYKQLREKEYILAPGVQDFTPASPQMVPDSYVSRAVTEFINQLGNVTAGNVDEQFQTLGESMSPQLKVKFLSEGAEWRQKVKSENIAEQLTVTEKEIRSNGQGGYEVTALARRDTYVANEYIGNASEVIEMTLELVPPKQDRRWYLQINTLSRQSEDTFKVKKGL